MIPGIDNNSNIPDTTKPKTPASNAKDPLADKSTFLQLLVAQIKNQDPMQPQDGVQFLSQLAQFSSLEQSMDTNKQLEAIQALLAKQVPAGPDTTAPPTTN
jgi:flagellar basal-body rod modification protein FlgD